MKGEFATGTQVNLGRHQRNCSVCGHEHREEIKAAFIGWRSPAAIAEEFGLADRASVYRRAHVLGLFPKRQKNIRAALERIIEKAGEVDVTASAVVAAVQAYAKINSAGEWIDRTETVSLNQLFDRMSTQELEDYAQTGALPGWFRETVGATGAGLRPGDYGLDSAQSRAAARALLDARRTVEGVGTLFRLLRVGGGHDPGRKCTCRRPEAGTFALCRCFYEAR
jgi:hypothetical protein